MEARAKKHGFDLKVSFDDSSTKFFKVFRTEGRNYYQYWQAERLCAELGASLPITVALRDAQKLAETLEVEELMPVGFRRRMKTQDNKTTFTAFWNNGHVAFHGQNGDFRKDQACPIMFKSTNLLSTENKLDGVCNGITKCTAFG